MNLGPDSNGIGLLHQEKTLQGLKSWVWLPKFRRTFGVLQYFSSKIRLLGDHPNFRKKGSRSEKAISELSESSGVFLEQLSEFEIPLNPFSEWHLTT